jgi:hypothetical protein
MAAMVITNNTAPPMPAAVDILFDTPKKGTKSQKLRKDNVVDKYGR